jgi:hypothetical protein
VIRLHQRGSQAGNRFRIPLNASPAGGQHRCRQLDQSQVQVALGCCLEDLSCLSAGGPRSTRPGRINHYIEFGGDNRLEQVAVIESLAKFPSRGLPVIEPAAELAAWLERVQLVRCPKRYS